MEELSPKALAEARANIDRSVRLPALAFIVSGVGWLLLGSLLALVASVKLHTPGFLSEVSWLTFGRVRPAHLNTMVYGWASMSGVGILLWLQCRLARVQLPFGILLNLVAGLWNLAVLLGTVALLAGYGTSVEWLEFPSWAGFLLCFCFAPIFLVSVVVFLRRRVRHVYISQWYLFGSVFWFPFLYVAANLLIHEGGVHGVAKGTANWWFAHNVLGIWFTPLGLASAYYFIPKVIGRPVHSYYLSVLGFWTLAIFYNWAGTHHLVGGPIPLWLQTVGIVASMMMFVPVVTVGINHHLTMVGYFHRLRTSPTLRFIVFGAMSYTLVSVQGSLTALRWVQETTHFTHYTVAHAHLGMYAFVTMTFFGALYYMVPRLTRQEWASATLIKVHFWSSAIGVGLYWVGLSWGGVVQGRMMLNPEVPFLDIVRAVIPYLWSRSVAGTLMTVGHLTFAYLIFRIIQDALLSPGFKKPGPTLFGGETGGIER